MFLFKTFVLLMVLASCSAVFDFLKLTWGANLFSSKYFKEMPRTVDEALDEGYELVSECDKSKSWRGARYVKNGDTAVILLYDKNGYIAGIQTAIPTNLPNGYPSHLTPPFVKDGDHYLLTAYFVDPAEIDICKYGRTQEEFAAQGTGTNLYIQIGTVAETDYIAIPHEEGDVAKTKWTEGKCFPTMGRHYWYNLSDDMDCQDFFPVFLLYNNGRLNGLGWAMMGDFSSPRYEHPPSSTFKLFIDSVPKCLSKASVTTMHIFLTNHVTKNTC